MNSEALIRDVRQRKNISFCDMFTLAHEHANGEDCFNASNSKYKSQLTDSVGKSSPTKKDRKRRSEFVVSTKKHDGSKPKHGHRGHGKFDEIMNKPCQNHNFPVTHLSKDCQTHKRPLLQIEIPLSPLSLL